MNLLGTTPCKYQCLRRQFIVNNSLGLHARAATRIAETIYNFKCEIRFIKNNLQADGGSVLSLLTLDASRGSTLIVEATGPQALEALEALEELFADHFGER